MTTATRHDLRGTPREARHAIPGRSPADPASDPSTTAQGPGSRPRRASPHDFAWPAHDLLTAEQECELARRRDEGDVGARNELAEKNLKLGAKMARDFVRRYPRMSREDAESAAAWALIRAADKFDPSMGWRFATYAGRWIWSFLQASSRESRYPVELPQHALDHEKAARLGRATRHRPPEHCLEAVRRVISAGVVGSTSGPDGSDSVGSLPAPHAEDPGEALDRFEAAGLLHWALGRMPEPEARAVRLRHGLGGAMPMGWPGIGRELGVTRETARNLEGRGMSRLRRLLAAPPAPEPVPTSAPAAPRRPRTPSFVAPPEVAAAFAEFCRSHPEVTGRDRLRAEFAAETGHLILEKQARTLYSRPARKPAGPNRKRSAAEREASVGNLASSTREAC